MSCFTAFKHLVAQDRVRHFDLGQFQPEPHSQTRCGSLSVNFGNTCAGHFGKDHFPCDHPECLETKFVVFATEQELRKHRMEQHRGEMVEGLSRAERRAALTIPINVNVRRGMGPPVTACKSCMSYISMTSGTTGIQTQ